MTSSVPILNLDPSSLRQRYDPSRRLDQYLELLRQENRRLNLVSRETSAADLSRLALQSLAVHEVVAPSAIASYLDIGSGGGLPSIPLLLCDSFRNGLQRPPVLVERTGKKAAALRRIMLALRLHAEIVVESLEQTRLAARFDLVTMRLVKLTPTLLDRIVALLTPSGKFVYFSAAPFEVAGPSPVCRPVDCQLLGDLRPQRLSIYSHQ